MIFTFGTLAFVLIVFVAGEVILWPHRETLLHSRDRKVEFMRYKLVRIRAELSVLSNRELQRFDHGLAEFVNGYDALLSVYLLVYTGLRPPVTTCGLSWSNRSLRSTLRALRTLEVDILTRSRYVDKTIMSWASRQLQTVLGELTSTQRWVELFLPEADKPHAFNSLQAAADELMDAHEELRYEVARLANTCHLVRMRSALTNARTAISDVQLRVEKVTDEVERDIVRKPLT